MAVTLFGSDRPRWEAEARRVQCDWYDPCPICFKCRLKASHLYAKCARCEVKYCGHNEKTRNRMIRRENFAIKQSQLGPDAIEAFRELGRRAAEEHADA